VVIGPLGPAAGTMKIGISLGVLRPSLWAELTREADHLGYESVWMPEHLVIPVGMAGSPHAGAEHPPIPADVPVFDVFAYLSFLAGQTEQIHFGTQVYNIGLRHPFIVARAVATLDVVSSGRLEFGIGASWLQAEWEAVGLDFATRGRRVDESIEVCRRLWSEDVVEHHGEFFDFGPVTFEPKPTHAPWPPLHIGGDGPAALRRAALVGDGWIPMNHTLEQIPADATRIARLREDAGRPGVVEITLGGGGTELDELKRFADAGVGRVLVKPWQRGSEAIDGIRRFAEQVLPEIRDHPVAPPTV
jgi:probable F420-dependent oxidoreductase